MKSTTKKMLRLVIAFLALLLIVEAPIASASTLSDLKSQKSKVEQKKNNIQNEINEKSNEINSIKSKQENLREQIKKITNQIVQTSDKIDKVNAQIDKKNQEIKKIQGEIKELQEKINQRDELLKERARAIQANGEVSYIDVILGAESFVDFIDRFSAVNTLIEADRQIMTDQKNDKRKLEEQELELQNAKKELESEKAKLKQLVDSLNKQEKEKNSLVSKLEKEEKNLTKEKASLQEELEEVVQLSQEINNKIAAEQEKYLRQLQSKNNKGNGGSSSSGGGSSSAGSDYKVSPGNWTNPASGTLTSPFGYRIHPVYKTKKFHYGIDIAKRGSNVPIYAAATGVVVHTGYLGGYGNTVIITHNLDGQVYTTLYAHLKGYSVSAGQHVNKGQRIATMGSTGVSTGQHLHFEVHTGTWKGQTVGAQNPLNYIPGY